MYSLYVYTCNLFTLFFQGYIDASEDGFKKFADDGEELVNSNHYASEEIKEKVTQTFTSSQ